jgi:RNA polymerase sigma factor (sigma-70 family)
MPTTPPRSILQAALSGAGHGLLLRTDAELLAAFASSRDEAAFAELVRRHARLVQGTARRLVRDPDAAADVFQATFLLLARKADAVPWGPTVGPWLYQAARRLGAKARALAARRPTPVPCDPDVPAPASDPSAGLVWAEVRDALDQALAALPSRLRDPLVLCYLEGLTQDEAAAALGCLTSTVKGRVTQGRERLRRLLARRGLSLSVALAGPLVAESSVAAGVAAATARAAAAFRASGVAAPSVLALLRGAPAAWKPTAALVGLALVCAAGAVGLPGPEPAAAPPPPPAAARADVREPADAFGDPLPPGGVARIGTRRLCGPPDDPRWLGFSPDGAKLASQNWYCVSVWDAATGRLLVERTDYRAREGAVAWRADGTGVALVRLPDWSYFVSAFTDPAEKLPTPPPAAGPPGNPNAAQIPGGPDVLDFLALSPDATRVALVRDPRAEQFLIDLLPATPGQALAALKPARTLGPFPSPCREVRYTAGGHLYFLTGPVQEKGDWAVSVVDPDKNVVARTTPIPSPGMCAWRYMLGLSADARLAAIPPRTTPAKKNTYDGTIRVWDLTAGKELWSLPFAGNAYGTGHAFAPDGKGLITSTDKSYFQVWDATSGKEAARPPTGFVERQGASAVVVSPDGKRFATARRDGRVDVWDTATGKAAVPLDTHRDVIDAVAVSPDGRLAATDGFDGSVRVWGLATGKPVCAIPVPADREPHQGWFGSRSRRRPTFAPDGRGLLFTEGGRLAMADPATGKSLDLPGAMRGQPGRIGGFTADGKTLATYTADAVTLWEWPAGAAGITVSVPVRTDQPAGGGEERERMHVHSAALSPDGRWLFTYAGRDGQPAAHDVWDARTGKHLHRLAAPQTDYLSAAFAADGRVLYLGGRGVDRPDQVRKLAAWDPAAGTLLLQFADPYPKPVAESPAAEAALKRRMDLRTVEAVAASPDGRLLAVAEFGFLTDQRPDYGVWLYETASGGLVKKLPGHSRWVNDLAFAPDGRRLVSVSMDQTGLVWDVTLPALGGKPAAMRPAEAWGRLTGPDPGPAYAGMAALAAAPAEAVTLLRAKLRPAPVPTEADLDRVVKQLDADSFDEREKAMAELERFGPNAVSGVKARLDRAPSQEVRTRLTRFLDKYTGPNPYQLRCIRGAATLEAIGTAEAKALLAELARGPEGDILTREARAASRREGAR